LQWGSITLTDTISKTIPNIAKHNFCDISYFNNINCSSPTIPVIEPAMHKRIPITKFTIHLIGMAMIEMANLKR
jgi:hypothetical protein